MHSWTPSSSTSQSSPLLLLLLLVFKLLFTPTPHFLSASQRFGPTVLRDSPITNPKPTLVFFNLLFPSLLRLFQAYLI